MENCVITSFKNKLTNLSRGGENFLLKLLVANVLAEVRNIFPEVTDFSSEGYAYFL